ncbi:CHAT domain-containing protein [Corynascus similis CBS 632.67]
MRELPTQRPSRCNSPSSLLPPSESRTFRAEEPKPPSLLFTGMFPLEQISPPFHRRSHPRRARPRSRPSRAMVRPAALILFPVADLFLMRFENHQIYSDLEHGCRVLRRALEHVPNNTDGLHFWCGKLAVYLQEAYDWNQDVDLLAESIEVSERGLHVVPDSDGASRASLLDIQANGLQTRAKRNGSMKDLNAAIRLSFRAVTVNSDPDKGPQYLTNLGCRLGNRFDRRKRADDLRDAIRVSRLALPTASGTPRVVTSIIKHNIGVKLLKLHVIDGKDATFEEGFSLLREAVETTPLPHDDVPAHWHNSLASAYHSRYWRGRGNPEDLNTAIQHQTLAIERVPQQHPSWPGYADNMAWLLRERAEHTGNLEDLQTALPFDLSIELYLQSLDDPMGEPLCRMVAASQLMTVFRERGEYARAVGVGEQVLNILRRVNTRLLDRDDQQRMIATFSDLAVETCASSIQAGDSPAKALELLELGRGLILGLLIEDRSEISNLAANYPIRAVRLKRLREDISRPADTGVDVASRQALVSQRSGQVREFDELLSEIRELPDQQRFFQGPTAQELTSLTTGGSIVVVNVAQQRSDAILVTANGIELIYLPGLRKEEIQAWLDKEPTRFRSRSEFGHKNKLCREYLAWLWTVCVEPILSTLRLLHDKPQSGELPRVWWIEAGLAAFLPFHAAGDHRLGSKANAYDHVVSSYAPTTRAFGYVQERASALRQLPTTSDVNDDRKPELLVVLMPTTPPVNGETMPPLVTATTELAHITAAAAATHTILPLVHPERDDVLARLAHCDIAHFVCHGDSDPFNPSESHLVLQRQPRPLPLSRSSASSSFPSPRGGHQQSTQNQQQAPVADLLTVRDLSSYHHHHHHYHHRHQKPARARIAYLSACSTAENRATKLIDEVIHLASGFQVACGGFSHVVATLWSADDEASVDVAAGFYRALSSSSSPYSSFSSFTESAAACRQERFDAVDEDQIVAQVLREAVLGVRERWRMQPLRWAGYVHFGV